MINLFLKAKHWQIFFGAFIIPFFGIFLLLAFTSGSNNAYEVLIVGQFLLTVFYMLAFFGWLWSIVVGLSPKLPASQPFKLKRFKAFLLVPAIYIMLIIPAMLFALPNLVSLTISIVPVLFILLLHLFSMFCIFHSIYQCAKVIKAIELNRKVSFGDFVGEFFLFWFFVIGVWILQPKINQFAQREQAPELTDHLIDEN